jgi:hypothetical protein
MVLASVVLKPRMVIQKSVATCFSQKAVVQPATENLTATCFVTMEVWSRNGDYDYFGSKLILTYKRLRFTVAFCRFSLETHVKSNNSYASSFPV